MIQTAVQISHRSSFSTPRLSLKTGDILPAKVISQNSVQSYNVAFRGITLKVKSQVPLTPGESVLLEFHQAAEALKFKYLQKISTVSLESQFSRLFFRLGIPDNGFNRSVLTLALKYHLPLVREHLSLLFGFWKKFRKDSQLTGEQLLEPYFFQQAASSPGTLTDPLFFARWFWGQFKLRKSIKNWKNNAAEQTEIPGGEGDAAENLPAFPPLFPGRLTLPAVRKVLEFALDIPLDSGKILKLYGMQEGDMEGQENHSPARGALRDVLNAFIFLQTQLLRYKNGLWAALPCSAGGKERFFFLRKSNISKKNKDFRVHFAIETLKFGTVYVDVLKKGSRIRLELQNPDQGFHRKADDKMAALQDMLRSAGIQNISVNHLVRKPHFSIINRIMTTERRLMEQKI